MATHSKPVDHAARGRLLDELELLAPVGDLELVADEVVPLEGRSASWLPDDDSGGEGLPLVLERIAAGDTLWLVDEAGRQITACSLRSAVYAGQRRIVCTTQK